MRMASDRVLRAMPAHGPFALSVQDQNTERLYCLNIAAEELGLSRGMGLSDARALCPDLKTIPANIQSDQAFLQVLARWAKRYCPWVGVDGPDGLVLDITGSAHLFGGEAALLDDLRLRVTRARLQVCLGLASTRGAAWALARHGEGIAPAGQLQETIAPLPVAALRIQDQTAQSLQRLGIRTIADLIALPRATVTRRFGRDLLLRLDQALGTQPETVSPLAEPPQYTVRLTLPDPIGLTSDVMAGVERLTGSLCNKLKAQEHGARVVQLTCRRVDQAHQQVDLRLARAMRDPARIVALFEPGVDKIDAGFGIDQMRLEAVQVEPLPVAQITHIAQTNPDAIQDLITRLGNRIGLENITRLLPADSHIPERSFIVAAAAYSDPASSWPVLRDRPLQLFPPEAIAGSGRAPPQQFRWRRMSFVTARATGPERLAPEWWFQDAAWRSGLRDYWKIQTLEGRRLWLFHTPQSPGWFVQGEFA
ncbi:Y-family DNA polymerase [Parasulfitobacter algicola]|nr:DNA polymerase Y family protein [Sulfitobacter algicola]